MFIPQRHFVALNEMTVVEMGELIEMYALAVDKFRELIPSVGVGDRLLFFWRLRGNLREEESGTTRMSHFHMHLTPDGAGLLDPVLKEDSCQWDPKDLVIKKSYV
jgi:diadenosine tetraphosphate (Ap4A) HIT family hydrolase